MRSGLSPELRDRTVWRIRTGYDLRNICAALMVPKRSGAFIKLELKRFGTKLWIKVCLINFDSIERFLEEVRAEAK